MPVSKRSRVKGGTWVPAKFKEPVFNPTQQDLDRFKTDFFNRGGTITVLKSVFDDSYCRIGKGFHDDEINYVFKRDRNKSRSN